jgi:hypothetical protein
LDVGFCTEDAREPTREPEKTNTVTTENIDPEVDLRRIHAWAMERDPDERGRLMAAAFTENGRPMVVVLNTN